MTASSTPDRILIKNAVVLTMEPGAETLEGADVLVEGSRIARIGHDIEADAEVIDGSAHIVLPGFVDTHRHTWESVIRHLGSDWTLGQYLTGVHFGMSRHYRPQDTYIGNLLGVAEALDSGITTLLDWSHNLETPAHADAAVQALFESGSRAVFAHGGGASMWQVPSELPHTDDVLRIRDQYFSSDDQLVTLGFAARGPQFATRPTTLLDWELARRVGCPITVHVGDGEWGKTRPVAWLYENGLMGPEVTYVHCNTLADEELQMIADTGGSASVSADIETQMGHGWPATGRLLAVGIRPSLSIDVCVSNGGDMFHAMKTTISTQRALENAAAGWTGQQDRIQLTCRDVLDFATLQGARTLGLESKIGSLVPGKEADIVMIRRDGLSLTPLNNPYGAVVYSAHAGMVDTVLVAGKVVKRDGRLTALDVNRIRDLALETREHLLAAAAGDAIIADAKLGGDWIPATATAE